MLARSQVTADGITTGRFYEVKCFTKDGNHVLIINNRFQMVAYPTSYFGILSFQLYQPYKHCAKNTNCKIVFANKPIL